MAVINYSAKVNYYDVLVGRPRGWQLIIPISSGVARGDTVNVVEVDANGTPTGNSMTGTVMYISTEVVFNYSVKNYLCYVVPD